MPPAVRILQRGDREAEIVWRTISRRAGDRSGQSQSSFLSLCKGRHGVSGVEAAT